MSNDTEFDEVAREARFRHFTEEELRDYRDARLDGVARARADAHLQLCLVCRRALESRVEDAAVIAGVTVTARDRARLRQRIAADHLAAAPGTDSRARAAPP